MSQQCLPLGLPYTFEVWLVVHSAALMHSRLTRGAIPWRLDTLTMPVKTFRM